MKSKYDTNTIEWLTYKTWLRGYKEHGASRDALQRIVTLMKPSLPLLALSADELKQAQVAEDDGANILTIEKLRKTHELFEQQKDEECELPGVRIVNPTHNKDVPETQEDINAAWERHKTFFGGR